MKTLGIQMSSPLLLLAVFASLASLSSAQLSGLPNLSTITQVAGATNTGGSTATKATGKHASDDSSASTTAATSATSAGGIAHLTGLPTLSGITIPTLVIPDTSDAPFMQRSSLPEGTIFICVGAILGFLGMCVLAWRGLIAWSLHRSVRRAAASQYLADKKPRYQASGTYSTQNVSMENLSNLNTSYAGGKGQYKHRTVTPNSSLFFSPTAGAGMYNHPNRTSSGYLPAGYYASGTAMPAAGTGVSHLGGGPGAAGYGRLSSLQNQSISPPDSPHMRPSDRPGDRSSAHSGHRPYSQARHGQGGGSTSSLNMPPQSRAPSAYLDDMFDSRDRGPRERH